MDARTITLLQWCQDNNLWIHPDLEISIFDHGSHASPLGVRALKSIEPLTTVVKIPKSCILSAKSSAFSWALPSALSDEDPNIVLSVVLLLELKLGSKSQWWGYLQSLPDTVAIASLWHEIDGEDGLAASQWLKGTEAGRTISAEQITVRLHDFYEIHARSLLASVSMDATFVEFAHAYALVSSRAFHIDAYHRISMVPIADVFNHVEDHHVHLESDYFVCPSCGSLEECHHDHQKSETVASQTTFFESMDDSCEMVTNALTQADEEVYNTYDSNLSDSQLLSHYGFTLDGNSNNAISWESLAEIDDRLNKTFQLDTIVSSHHQIFSSLIRTKVCPQSDLIFSRAPSTIPNNGSRDPQTTAFDRTASLSPHEANTLPRKANSEHQVKTEVDPNIPLLCINADGALSYELYAFIFAWSLTWNSSSDRTAALTDDAASRLHDVNDNELLWNLVTYFMENLSLPALLPPHEEHYLIQAMISKISTCIEMLCTEKIDGMHQPGSTAPTIIELGELLDALPSNRPLTRLAVEYVLSERSIMESCMAGWMDLIYKVDGDPADIT